MMFKRLFVVVAIIILGILTADAYASESIKERMISRLPVINDLKARGVIGENNLGFLEFVGNRKEKADVVEAENMDRKTVYEAIAKKQGATVELVGKHRAVQIAEKARPGELLQDANGKWYKKQ